MGKKAEKAPVPVPVEIMKMVEDAARAHGRAISPAPKKIPTPVRSEGFGPCPGESSRQPSTPTKASTPRTKNSDPVPTPTKVVVTPGPKPKLKEEITEADEAAQGVTPATAMAETPARTPLTKVIGEDSVMPRQLLCDTPAKKIESSPGLLGQTPLISPDHKRLRMGPSPESMKSGGSVLAAPVDSSSYRHTDTQSTLSLNEYMAQMELLRGCSSEIVDNNLSYSHNL